MVDLFFDKITTSWGENFLIAYERFGIGKPLVIINKYQMEQLIKAWNIETNSAPNSQQENDNRVVSNTPKPNESSCEVRQSVQEQVNPADTIQSKHFTHHK